MTTPSVTIVGAGLAGTEAALQLAGWGIAVRLLEQKPQRLGPAHHLTDCCELVCSNSFRGAALSNAVGLLKEELRRLGSAVMLGAEECRVPAGGALAVDRERFAALMTERLRAHPLITVEAAVVERIPVERPCIIATGPLTDGGLAADLEARLGTPMAYYDAIAPIVSAESIDFEQAFFASRWGKGESEEEQKAYLNCPLSKEEYAGFVAAIAAAEKVPPREFEEPRYFEGCLPVEVMVERGAQTLAFGPMKPVGLTDPRTGRWPGAVVQLRKEDEAGTAYNLVGFQSRMTWPEQKRVFSMIPALRHAEFLRYGAVHRNTFVNAPSQLGPRLELRSEPGLYLAGQITGTEGYVESCACGWLAAWYVASAIHGWAPTPFPATTAMGGILAHLARESEDFQPSNITFAQIAPWEGARLKKRARYEAMAHRSLRDLAHWAAEQPVRFEGAFAPIPGSEASTDDES